MEYFIKDQEMHLEITTHHQQNYFIRIDLVKLLVVIIMVLKVSNFIIEMH